MDELLSDDTVERQQQLLNLINTDNAKSLTLDDLVIGLPQPANYQNRNTSVVVSGKENSRYVGDETFYYSRLPLEKLAGLSILSDQPVTPAELLVLINTEKNTDLQVTDLEPVEIPDPNELEPVEVALIAKPHAIKWTGNTSVSLTASIPDISPLQRFVHETIPSLV